MSNRLTVFQAAVIATILHASIAASQTWTGHEGYIVNIDNIAFVDIHTRLSGTIVTFLGGPTHAIKVQWPELETAVKDNSRFLILSSGYLNLRAVSRVWNNGVGATVYFTDGQSININREDYDRLLQKLFPSWPLARR
jgi:hypothetical protein